MPVGFGDDHYVHSMLACVPFQKILGKPAPVGVYLQGLDLPGALFLPSLLPTLLTIGHTNDPVMSLALTPSYLEHMAHLGSFVQSFIMWSTLTHLRHNSLPGHTTLYLVAVCPSMWHLKHLCTFGWAWPTLSLKLNAEAKYMPFGNIHHGPSTSLAYLFCLLLPLFNFRSWLTSLIRSVQPGHQHWLWTRYRQIQTRELISQLLQRRTLFTRQSFVLRGCHFHFFYPNTNSSYKQVNNRSRCQRLGNPNNIDI